MARKGENIYKRKDGRWEGRYISSYDNAGKAKYSYVYARSYNEVKQKLNNSKMRPSITAPSMPRTVVRSVASLSAEWLNTKRLNTKLSTFIRYQNILDNHILPQLGDCIISCLDTVQVKSFVQEKLQKGRLDGKGGLSAKTVTDTLAVLKNIFKYAQNLGINTSCDFNQITIKKNTREMRVLSTNEEKRLIAVLSSEMDRFKLGVYICLFTGIRIGELCALQWKHISFVEQTLKIDQTMQRLQHENKDAVIKTKVVITEPKSFAAIRTIPLPSFLITILRPFAESPNSFLLSGCSKDFVEPRTMQNRFKGYLKEGQISNANFHALRHTFATRCIELGFEVKALSEILGHSSVKITLDKYVHSSMEQKLLNMEKLSRIG